MAATVVEKHKRSGVCYAVSDDGLELPVINVTDAAFACPADTAALQEIAAITLKNLERTRRMPLFLWRLLAGKSILTRDRAGTYVGGMTTYLQKLGPENLGRGYAGRVDFLISRRIGPVSMRLRLQQMAQMLAEEITPLLRTRPRAPLHLLNIGGGAAPDSWNALIVLARSTPGLLRGRKITIHVLDCEADGAHFGARALAALCQPGEVLAGLDAGLVHVPYDWNETGPLVSLLGEIGGDDAVIAGASEGGVFEYGTDDVIRANLAVLRAQTPPDVVIVGSVIRDAASVDPTLPILKGLSKISFRMLGREGLAAPARDAGWTVSREGPHNPVYQVLSLKKLA